MTKIKTNSSDCTVSRVKTGKLERRFALAKAGLFASARFASQSFANSLFGDPSRRESRQRAILSEQSHYLTTELGKLKGSVVKVGQMLALWGEHFLPPEVTKALHTLENSTASVDWQVIKSTLMTELGHEKLSQLTVERNPIGAASLGQVHRATCLKTGAQICLKVQYPGVAEAIDSDLDAIATLLKVSKLVPITQEFKTWFEEIRAMLKREVDYALELVTTERFKQYLANDDRYIVPSVYREYSSAKVLATSYEPGIGIGSPECQLLSQARRDDIAAACLDLCWREVFEWGEMQTDPNFGNYFVRLCKGAQQQDQIVLLDFGAVRQFPQKTLDCGREIIKGAFYAQPDKIRGALISLGFVSESLPQQVFDDFTVFCQTAMEPFINPNQQPAIPIPPAYDLSSGKYDWASSDLAARVLAKATRSAFSRHFSVPPKELMFLSRKVIGAYTLMSVLAAQINGEALLKPYVAE